MTSTSRRLWLYCCGAVGIGSVAGCLDDDDEPASDADTDEDPDGTDDTVGAEDAEDDEDDEAEPADEDTPDLEGVIVEGGQSHSFDGSGTDVSEAFELEPGILIVEFAHDGESNFRVDMIALEGEAWDDVPLVNVIGDTDGSSVLSITGGEYQLDVAADGAWTLELDQPEVTAGEVREPPLEESGTGSSWVGPVRAEGVNEIHATHDGEGNFVAWAHDVDGGQDLLVNEVGEYDGTSTFRADGEVFWINIEADGDWTIAIE